MYIEVDVYVDVDVEGDQNQMLSVIKDISLNFKSPRRLDVFMD